jgi:hypothetical protein
MRRWIVAALLVLAAGCKGRTELVFGFATDLRAKGQIDHVAFKVFNAPSQVIEVSQEWDLADVPAGLYELPGSFGVYTDGAEPSLQIDFVGSLGGQTIVQRESVLSPIKNKTLFMRMTLVGECDVATGAHCPSGQTCVEGVCRAPEVDHAILPLYKSGMVGRIDCNSGTQFVLTSTGAPLEPAGSCSAGQFCQEGTCYETPPGATQAIGVSDWMPTPLPVTTTVHGVFTTTGGDVFGVGEHGVILHAPAGGGDLVDETFDPLHGLVGVWGTSTTDLWAVGAGGVVLHRTAAGWAVEPGVPATQRLSAIWGVGGELWAVGRGSDGAGTILHRAASGAWSAEPAPAGAGELSALWGSGAGDVWAVGAGFTILHYDGSAWRSGPTAPEGASTDLLAVGGSGAGDVYFVGRGGAVAHLGADGTLVTQPSPKPYDLYALWASGAGDIYAVGDYGIILHSAGDGVWMEQESGTRDPLFAIDGSGPANVYAAGRVGTILHFGSGGAPPDMAPPGACTAAADCGTSCTAGMLTVRACDQGQCSDLTPAACAGGYQCAGASACATSCGSDGDCQVDFYCDTTAQCQPRKAQGAVCNADAGGECKGADCHVCRDGLFCTDHVCCDQPSAQCGGCMLCAAPSGTCVVADANSDPHNYCPATGDECQAAACNGQGSCAKPNATACGADVCSGNQLTKHTCQSGACTAASPTSCAGGTTCASDGKSCVGKCAQDSDCAQTGTGSYCDSNGDCQPRKAQAGTCNLAAGGDCKVAGCGECQGGLSCADGFCCNQACGGACEACDLAGKIGSCSPVPAKAQPHHGAACPGAGTPTCGGSCDGTNRTACAVPPASTKAIKATCTARDALTPATLCDGAGYVGATGAAVGCAGAFACEPSGSSATDDQCWTECATVAQCANDNLACDGNKRCGYPDGAQCKPAAPGDCASDVCWQSPKDVGICCGTACASRCNPKDTTRATQLTADCSKGACSYVSTQCSSGYACRDDTGVCSTACKCDDAKLTGDCASADCRVNTLCRKVPKPGAVGGGCD